MLIQAALTYAVDAIAITGISGIIVHAFYTSHCQWMAANCPPVKPFQEEAIAPQSPQSLPIVLPEVKVEAQPEMKSEGEEVAKAIPPTEVVEEVVKPRETRSKKIPQPKLQPLSVGAAVLDYSAMTSEQLRKECGLQGINWRTGSDRRKPMRKLEMLAALGHFQD